MSRSVGLRLESVIFLLLTAGLGAFLFVEWRRSREDAHALVTAYGAREDAFRRWAALEFQKLRTVSRDLSKKVDRLGDRDRRVVPVGESSEDEVQDVAAELDPESQEAAPEIDTEPLPKPIPDPALFVGTMDVPGFFEDPDFNPESVELSPSQRIRAMTDVEIARLRIQVLEKEIKYICAENIDRMRAAGEYLEYPRGQAPDPVERGTVSYGETTEAGGMRLYYFFPEEFPEIREKRELQDRIGEETVRKLLAYVDRGA